MIAAEVKPAGIFRGGVKEIFRLMTEEDAKLKDLIKCAHHAGYVKKPKFQLYMKFALNCAYPVLEEYYRTGVMKKGLQIRENETPPLTAQKPG